MLTCKIWLGQCENIVLLKNYYEFTVNLYIYKNYRCLLQNHNVFSL